MNKETTPWYLHKAGCNCGMCTEHRNNLNRAMASTKESGYRQVLRNDIRRDINDGFDIFRRAEWKISISIDIN